MKLITAPTILLVVLTFCGLGQDRSQNTGQHNDRGHPPDNRVASPMDRDETKNELLRLINEIADASVDGDRAYLNMRTTEDFQLTDVEGRVLDKKKALDEVKRESAIMSWVITEAELGSLTEDSAVMTYLMTLTGANGQKVKARVTDTFSRKDGEWLLKSEQQTLVR